MTNKSKNNRISEQTFEILEKESFNQHSVEQSSDDLDKLYFFFMNSDIPSDNERGMATYSFFAIKKLLQSLKEKTDPSNLSKVNVDVTFYAG